MATTFDLADVKRRMQGAINAFKHDLASLRTGRASPNILDPIQVDAYGSLLPITQVATVNVPEPRLLSVQIWDRSNISAVEKAIRNAGLGINPITDGQNIRLLSVQVWDRGMVTAVEKAIRESDLGLNPQTEGQVIRLRIPEMNEQRRKEMVKVAHKYAEEARIAVRHVRRDGLDLLKKLEKDSAISEDDAKREGDQVQKATDQFVAEIDQLLVAKEKEIMQV